MSEPDFDIVVYGVNDARPGDYPVEEIKWLNEQIARALGVPPEMIIPPPGPSTDAL